MAPLKLYKQEVDKNGKKGAKHEKEQVSIS